MGAPCSPSGVWPSPETQQFSSVRFVALGGWEGPCRAVPSMLDPALTRHRIIRKRRVCRKLFAATNKSALHETDTLDSCPGLLRVAMLE